jgi:hypothetical protein
VDGPHQNTLGGDVGKIAHDAKGVPRSHGESATVAAKETKLGRRRNAGEKKVYMAHL